MVDKLINGYENVHDYLAVLQPDMLNKEFITHATQAQLLNKLENKDYLKNWFRHTIILKVGKLLYALKLTKLNIANETKELSNLWIKVKNLIKIT